MCATTDQALSPCVLLDPDIQELIYNFLGLQELLSVDSVCKSTRVTKDKYLKAIQAHTFNKVQRFVDRILPQLKWLDKVIISAIKPYDFIAKYDTTQLHRAWEHALKIDGALDVWSWTIDPRPR